MIASTLRYIHAAAILLLLTTMVSCSSTTDEAETEYSLGDEAFSRLDFKQALLHYDEAIRINDEHAGAHFKRGQIRWQSNQFERAVTDLGRAIELDPDITWAYFFRAASNIALRRYDLSVPDLDRVISSGDFDKADMVRTYTWRAIAQFNLERYDEAIEDYTRCIELHPDRYVHRVDRGWVYEVNDQAAEAIRDYQYALRMSGLDSAMVRTIEGRLDELGARVTAEEAEEAEEGSGIG